MTQSETPANARAHTPALEWIAAALGLSITLAMLTIIGRDAIRGSGGTPVLEAIAGETRRVPTGHVVAFTVANRAPAAAASVEVEGVLTLPGEVPETSGATLDYVAGGSDARGAMMFAGDPSAGRLEVRVRGFTEP